MGTKITNIDATGSDREIGDIGVVVPFGETVEIDDSDLAERLLKQETVWARPTTKAAKQAEKES